MNKMANNPLPPKPKIKTVSDWINRPRQQGSDAFERHRKLWDALNRFIHNQGDAWLVSLPRAKFLRIECKQGSALPAKLSELGYNPRHCGMNTRIVSGGFASVDVIEITLGQ